MYVMFGNVFIQLNDSGKDGFILLKSSVACKLLNELYNKFILDGIPPIESLPEDKKINYYNISKKHCEDKDYLIMVSKAAYVLNLITSNE